MAMGTGGLFVQQQPTVFIDSHAPVAPGVMGADHLQPRDEFAGLKCAFLGCRETPQAWIVSMPRITDFDDVRDADLLPRGRFENPWTKPAPEGFRRGVVAQGPRIGSLAPQTEKRPVCLQHGPGMRYRWDKPVASPSPQKPAGIGDLDPSRQWRLEGRDPNFAFVTDGNVHAMIATLDWVRRQRGEI